MRLDVVTIFPDFFDSPLSAGLLGKALSAGGIEVIVHDLRQWAGEPHRKVDDETFGGGAGMVMTPGPLVKAVREIDGGEARVVILSASGRLFDQSMAGELAQERQVILVCGRYEGIDDRVRTILGAEEVSVGDFVLTGGETASLAVIESVARLGEKFLGNADSLSEESFSPGSSGLLEYPQYTRPAEFEGEEVPEVLRSGNHEEIRRWRRTQSLRRTFERRPELLARADLSDGERDMIESWRQDERGI